LDIQAKRVTPNESSHFVTGHKRNRSSKDGFPGDADISLWHLLKEPKIYGKGSFM